MASKQATATRELLFTTSGREVYMTLQVKGMGGGARGTVVGRGTMLQAVGPRVPFPIRSLDFSIHLILSAALWPWGRLSL
jgi:hypothetical protein